MIDLYLKIKTLGGAHQGHSYSIKFSYMITLSGAHQGQQLLQILSFKFHFIWDSPKGPVIQVTPDVTLSTNFSPSNLTFQAKFHSKSNSLLHPSNQFFTEINW